MELLLCAKVAVYTSFKSVALIVMIEKTVCEISPACNITKLEAKFSMHLEKV